MNLCLAVEGNKVREGMLTLEAGRVDVWQIDLYAHMSNVTQYWEYLSMTEKHRVRRLRFERDQKAMTIAHGAMREILGYYLKLDPHRVVLSQVRSQKPKVLAGHSGAKQIEFNLSHSGRFALLAVTCESRVGIDLECIAEGPDIECIATSYFTSGEADILRRMSGASRREWFYSCWTRKESYVKATGQGLTVPLDSFTVALGPGIAPALISVLGAPEESQRWVMFDIDVTPKYRAALTVEKHTGSHCSTVKRYELLVGRMKAI